MQIKAPAKINLSLRILGKRPDGYHALRSLMAPITLADTLDIEVGSGSGVHFSCSDPELSGDDNLVVRAARLFLERTSHKEGLRIHLEKQVPHGAGLGGGSSDAASTFLALNSLFESGLDTATLAHWSAELGSDIPFFIYRSVAWIEGRGEVVLPVDFPHRIPLLLVKPPFGVPTPWAYQKWAASQELPDVPYALQAEDWGGWVNDLERPVFEKYLVLAELKRSLLESDGVRAALLSGSGSTVFAVLKPLDDESLQLKVQALQVMITEKFGPSFRVYFASTIPTSQQA